MTGLPFKESIKYKRQ